MKRRFLSLLGILLVLTMLVACTNGGGTTATPTPAAGGDTPSAGSDAPSGGDTPSDGGTDAPDGMPSKTVTIVLTENANRMDPLRDNNSGGAPLKSSVFESLLYCDPETGTFYPLLAKDWEVSDDGCEWTFYLREGVEFHNGEPFTSADCAATYQRIIDDGAEIGAANSWPHFDRYEAVDDYTFKLYFKYPDAMTAQNISTFYIMPDEAYAEYGTKFWEDQIMYGTGPWIFDEWVDGQHAKLHKNPNWWNKDKYDSYYEEMVLRYIFEPATAVAAHLAGDVNCNFSTGGIAKELLHLYDGTEDRIDMYNFNDIGFMYFGFGMLAEDSPFRDINFRKAFTHGVDRDTIAKQIYGSDLIAPSFLVQTSPAYDSSITPDQYDPDLAKEYLAKSNYDPNRVVKLTGMTSTLKAEETLLATQGYLRDIGISAEINIVDYAVFNEIRGTGNYDCFFVILHQPMYDPINGWKQRIVTDLHHSGFVDEELNAMITEAAQTIDTAERYKLYPAIAQKTIDLAAPQFAIVQMQSDFAIDKGIVGWQTYNANMCRYIDYLPDLEARGMTVYDPTKPDG